jgi:bacterioferritin-associated ferredoxin
VSSSRIAGVAREGARTVEEIQQQLPAGQGCSSCRPEIEQILAGVHGIPYPANLADQNRQTCREQSERRVANAVYGAISLRLPPGVTVEFVSVNGLTVDLHVGGADKAAERRIAERLRKLVCPDLLVVFS